MLKLFNSFLEQQDLMVQYMESFPSIEACNEHKKMCENANDWYAIIIPLVCAGATMAKSKWFKIVSILTVD